MLAVKRLGGGSAPALDVKDSVERRLLSSLCYDFGTALAARFRLDAGRGENARLVRKLAHKLFWSHLDNFHVLQNLKLSFGGRALTLKSVCSTQVSRAIWEKTKTS